MTMAQRVQRTPKFHATVGAARHLSPKMRRLTLTDPQLSSQHWPLGCEIAVVLAGEDDREVRRRYTVREANADSITIDALLHGHGAGASWAAAAQLGDGLDFYGPRGELPLNSLAPVIALTDESGLPAIGALVEAMNRPIRVLAEIADVDEYYPLATNADVSWILRGANPAGSPDLLITALGQLTEPFDYAYVINESRAVLQIRDALEQRGLHRTNIYFKGYWNLRSRSAR